MNRNEITNAFFERNKGLLERITQDERNHGTNPALRIHEKIEARPYTKEDFIRKEFHMNLVRHHD
jgi:hypothetical protein